MMKAVHWLRIIETLCLQSSSELEEEEEGVEVIKNNWLLPFLFIMKITNQLYLFSSRATKRNNDDGEDDEMMWYRVLHTILSTFCFKAIFKI